MQELEAGRVGNVVERWRTTGYAPFPGEDWDLAYSWLQKVTVYTESVLQTRLQTALQTVNSLTHRGTQLERTNSELQTENKLLKSLSNRTPTRSNPETIHLKSQISLLKQGIKERDNEISDLSKEIEINNHEIERLSLLLAHFKAEKQSKSTESQSEDLRRLLQEVQELKEERKILVKSQDDCDRLKIIINDQEKLISELQNRENPRENAVLEELKSTKRHLKDLEKQHLEEIEELRESKNAEKRILVENLPEISPEIGKINRENEFLKSENEKLAGKIAELESKLVVLESNLSKSQGKISILSREKTELELNIEENHEKIHELERNLSILRLNFEGEVSEKAAILDINKDYYLTQIEGLKAKNEALEREIERGNEVKEGDFTGEMLVKQYSERVEEAERELKAALEEGERHYYRVKELEGASVRLDEATTELEILKQEYLQSLEDHRAFELTSRTSILDLTSKLKQNSDKSAEIESHFAICKSHLRLKEEEIVHLTGLIDQYKRQIEDCRDLLAGELPNSKRAKAYAAGLACDWDLVGKISDQLEAIEELQEKLNTAEKRINEQKALISTLEIEKNDFKDRSQRLENELIQVETASKSLEKDYKSRLETFQRSLTEQKEALRQSHEELMRRSSDLQADMHRYELQKEQDAMTDREMRRERELTMERDRESEGLSSDEVRRFSEASILSVTEAMETIGNMLDEWRKSLHPALQAKLPVRKIAMKGEINSDLGSIKSAVAGLIADFHVVSGTKVLDTSAEYENTLDFAKRLLQRFDREGGHVEEALIVQLIIEKLSLEREIKKKTAQLIEDDRFLAHAEGLKDEGNRVKWVTARWQESENEAYRLRSQYCENTKRLEDFFEEKGVGDRGTETLAELRKQVKSLRKELQDQSEKYKVIDETRKSEGNLRPVVHQTAVENLLNDMKSQQIQQKAMFENKEKTWREAMRRLKDGLQQYFTLNLSSVGKGDLTDSPGIFVSLILEAVETSRKKSSEELTSQQRASSHLQVELDSWLSKQEAWETEKATLKRNHDRTLSEAEKLRNEVSKGKELIDKVMNDYRELARRAETEIPEENYNRGLVDGEIIAKKEKKRLKLVISEYRDQMEQLKVKYEGLQDKVVALTAQVGKLQQEKQQLMEEVRVGESRMDLRSRVSTILQRTRTMQSRVGENGRDQDIDFDLQKPILESHDSSQMSFEGNKDVVTPPAQD